MAYPTDLTNEQWELLEPVLGDRGFRGLEGPMLRDHDVTVEIKHRSRLPGENKADQASVESEGLSARWLSNAELGRWLYQAATQM